MPLKRLKSTIATPSFSVDSPNAKLNMFSLTCIDSMIAITATGSTADTKEEYVRDSYTVKLDFVNEVVEIIKIPITIVEISVPITAYTTISRKLWKNALLLRK